MGLEYARQLAGRGFDLILVSNREEELAAAGSSLEAEYPVQVRTRFQDLARPRAADELYEWCRAEGILPDLLVKDRDGKYTEEMNEICEGGRET